MMNSALQANALKKPTHAEVCDASHQKLHVVNHQAFLFEIKSQIANETKKIQRNSCQLLLIFSEVFKN